ncbi:NAD(P)-dependent dehydrogenase (short-subunit alcohol dehydrogenase family) [Neobacillus ginsengisoli]|uniref:NAD(P)-dependent dehydrogenase (Short-subunit alcohol dehydrogenase family) n=2 Tax=Neobacillus ginsengisoli TaxID=904295 RepID=A0ABT9XXP5_9BACI|nr:NAD(P)-dependent dehydrogenase (short-subunit alcohol dehydrogenase family) [Neobacillus ginsengisoli]
MENMVGKVCLVTGASQGIGKATAIALAKMKATVIMVSFDQGRGEAALKEIKSMSGNENIELLLADLSSRQSIRQLADRFKQKYTRLDVLVNNAGVMKWKQEFTTDGFESTFAINHLASFLLTNLLLDLLKASAPARILNVSSSAQAMGKIEFDDLDSRKKYSGIKAYSQSKLANVLFTYELDRILQGTGVTVNCLHPGVVRTNFGNTGSLFFKISGTLMKPFMLPPDKGAETSIFLASSPQVEGISAKYFVKKKAVNSSPISYDEMTAKKLWEVSTKMTKLS